MISIYYPLLQNSKYFLNSVTKIIDNFAKTYDNHLILGYFNLEPTDSALMGFLESNSLTNLIKTNTCFKIECSCIDLVLTNNKFSLKFTSTYETGISDQSTSYDEYNVKVLFSKYEIKNVCGDSYDKFENIDNIYE